MVFTVANCRIASITDNSTDLGLTADFTFIFTVCDSLARSDDTADILCSDDGTSVGTACQTHLRGVCFTGDRTAVGTVFQLIVIRRAGHQAACIAGRIRVHGSDVCLIVAVHHRHTPVIRREAGSIGFRALIGIRDFTFYCQSFDRRAVISLHIVEQSQICKFIRLQVHRDGVSVSIKISLESPSACLLASDRDKGLVLQLTQYQISIELDIFVLEGISSDQLIILIHTLTYRHRHERHEVGCVVDLQNFCIRVIPIYIVAPFLELYRDILAFSVDHKLLLNDLVAIGFGHIGISAILQEIGKVFRRFHRLPVLCQNFDGLILRFVRDELEFHRIGRTHLQSFPELYVLVCLFFYLEGLRLCPVAFTGHRPVIGSILDERIASVTVGINLLSAGILYLNVCFFLRILRCDCEVQRRVFLHSYIKKFASATNRCISRCRLVTLTGNLIRIVSIQQVIDKDSIATGGHGLALSRGILHGHLRVCESCGCHLVSHRQSESVTFRHGDGPSQVRFLNGKTALTVRIAAQSRCVGIFSRNQTVGVFPSLIIDCGLFRDLCSFAVENLQHRVFCVSTIFCLYGKGCRIRCLQSGSRFPGSPRIPTIGSRRVLVQKFGDGTVCEAFFCISAINIEGILHTSIVCCHRNLASRYTVADASLIVQGNRRLRVCRHSITVLNASCIGRRDRAHTADT